MTGWFVSNLGDAMLAQDGLEKVRSRFDATWRRQGGPADMGLFVRHVSEGRLHCEVLLYFSPAAAALAHESGAMPCGAPSLSGLDLLAGSDHALREP